MSNLQIELNNIISLKDINEFNNLLKKCANLYQLEAVVYIFDYMKQLKFKPDDETYRILNTLHSKKIQDKSNLIVQKGSKKTLQPKRRIHKIMKGYNYSKALKNKDIVINYLTNNEYDYDGKDKRKEKVLINVLKLHCKLPVPDIRHILTYLKRQKYFIK